MSSGELFSYHSPIVDPEQEDDLLEKQNRAVSPGSSTQINIGRGTSRVPADSSSSCVHHNNNKLIEYGVGQHRGMQQCPGFDLSEDEVSDLPSCAYANRTGQMHYIGMSGEIIKFSFLCRNDNFIRLEILYVLLVF